MSTCTADLQERKITLNEAPPSSPIDVTERASRAVMSIVNQQRVQRLEELAPDLVQPYQTLQTEKGRAPTLDELAGAVKLSEQELLAKLGAACLSKADALPAEYRDLQRELTAANLVDSVPGVPALKRDRAVLAIAAFRAALVAAGDLQRGTTK